MKKKSFDQALLDFLRTIFKSDKPKMIITLDNPSPHYLTKEEEIQAMITQHTPGPWITSREGNGLIVATESPNPMYPGIGYIVAKTIGNGEQDNANARLIAAAPETAAERDSLKAENDRLKDVEFNYQQAGEELKRTAIQLERLKALNAEMGAALEKFPLPGLLGDDFWTDKVIAWWNFKARDTLAKHAKEERRMSLTKLKKRAEER
jgi:hypothetical protein